jgi:hypothetical protein
MNQISEADLARSRSDPRFKQDLLAKALEQLLATLYRMQHDPVQSDAASQRQLREGALMAVELADLIRDLDERVQLAKSA